METQFIPLKNYLVYSAKKSWENAALNALRTNTKKLPYRHENDTLFRAISIDLWKTSLSLLQAIAWELTIILERIGGWPPDKLWLLNYLLSGLYRTM
jgi:hypothetical protein